MKNHWTIDDYQLVEDKKIRTWLCILVLLFITIGIVIILCKLDFQVYEKQTLIKNDDNFILIIDSTKITEFESTPYIYINQRKYKYEIKEIAQDYSNIDGNIYQTIYINPYNYKTDAIITECYFLKSKKTIYEMICEFIKGGIG